MLNRLREDLGCYTFGRQVGRVTRYVGLIAEASGLDAFVGELCKIWHNQQEEIDAEVVGFRDGYVLLMPYGDSRGVTTGARVSGTGEFSTMAISAGFVGRVIDPFGKSLDGRPLNIEIKKTSLHRTPINPLERNRISRRLNTGVATVDIFTPLGRGQRLGVFSGSGVGKSTLLGMMASQSAADVNVIAMIGERGREVKDFIDDNLGEKGLSKSVVIVATAEQPPIVRYRALLAALAVAEFLSHQGKDVLLTVDSITRFATALREIALSAGEPPATRGYPPSVFSILPAVVERLGSFSGRGAITGLLTILVEGDDFNEPIADTMRSILDGHIVLSRKKASEGIFPAIDIFKSLSRLESVLHGSDERKIIEKIKNIMLAHQQIIERQEFGLYVAGRVPKDDLDKEFGERIIARLKQRPQDCRNLDIVLAEFTSWVTEYARRSG